MRTFAEVIYAAKSMSKDQEMGSIIKYWPHDLLLLTKPRIADSIADGTSLSTSYRVAAHAIPSGYTKILPKHAVTPRQKDLTDEVQHNLIIEIHSEVAVAFCLLGGQNERV